MNPTHILVAIDKYNNIKGDPEDVAWEIQMLLTESPGVDLSEEGIWTKATDNAIEKAIPQLETIYKMGYLQCAKDLLNAK